MKQRTKVQTRRIEEIRQAGNLLRSANDLIRDDQEATERATAFHEDRNTLCHNTLCQKLFDLSRLVQGLVLATSLRLLTIGLGGLRRTSTNGCSPISSTGIPIKRVNLLITIWFPMLSSTTTRLSHARGKSESLRRFENTRKICTWRLWCRSTIRGKKNLQLDQRLADAQARETSVI